MKTLVTFHEGLKGSGVVVSVVYNKDRIIFDFGAPFKPDSDLYDGIVKHRSKSIVKDAIKLMKVPAIDGVFNEEDIKGIHIISAQDSELNTAIFISHLHLDHMSNIGMVDPSIPIYMHEDAYKLQCALNKINEGVGERDYTPLKLYEEINVGGIKVTAYFSDHPCFGSVGYLIQTPDQNIYYSGDIRFHGLQKERAFSELDKIAHQQIDLLIIDGTSYSPSKFIRNNDHDEILIRASMDILEGGFLEEKIYEDVLKILNKSSEIGIFNIYHRDMQLIKALIDVASKANREIVFEIETAFIIKSILNINVNYYLQDTSNALDNECMNFIKTTCHEIKIEEINANVSHYLIQNSYKNILNLIDINTDNGNYFHLFGAPFVKSEKGYEILEMLIQRYNLKHFAYANLFSFNHAFPNHLSYMIYKIDAKSVVAVHSNTPEKLNPINSKHYLPKKNVCYELVNGYLHEIVNM